MKRTTLRAAGISAIAAVAIGIAAPAASAATTAPVRTVAAVQSADVTTTGAPGLNIASQAPAPSPWMSLPCRTLPRTPRARRSSSC